MTCKSEPRDILISWVMPTSEEYYNGASGADIAAYIPCAETAIAAFVQQRWPGATFEYSTVREAMSFGNQSTVYVDGNCYQTANDQHSAEEAWDIFAAIENYVENHWPEWFPTESTD